MSEGTGSGTGAGVVAQAIAQATLHPDVVAAACARCYAGQRDVVKLLVTGFEPFGALAENPSATLVRELSRRAAVRPHDYPELRVAILPTEFAKAAQAIRELLQIDVPDVLLALGVAPRAQGVRLERTARNRDDAALRDNAGELRQLTPIVPGGPDTLASTLPIEAMQAALEDLGVQVAISDDAGGYVCNHLFYAARHVIDSRRLPTQCGFVHIPLCTEQVSADGNASTVGTLPRARLLEAVECCIRVIQALAAEGGGRLQTHRQNG